MKTKDAKKLLNCSSMTITNYIRSGKLRLNKTLPNGRYDINDESVYELIGLSQSPKKDLNYILIIDSNGNRHEFFPDNITTIQVAEYIQNKIKFSKIII